MASVANMCRGLSTETRKKCDDSDDSLNLCDASGDEYVPETEAESSEDGESEPHPPIEKRRKRRGAKREAWKKNIRKKRRNSGKSYISVKGTMVEAKHFREFICKCRNKCHLNVDVEDRKTFYHSFWVNGTFESQTAAIACSVKCLPKTANKGQGNDTKQKREFCRQYFIPSKSGDVRVCKEMFIQTLRIDSARIHRALQKMARGDIVDRRGRHTPSDKLSTDRMKCVEDHISSFPAYSSHYCRSDNPNKKFLSHTLNLSIMYRLYKETMQNPQSDNNQNSGNEIVSQSMYEKIFYTKFNLGFKPPQKDTCKKCDILALKTGAAEVEPDSQEKTACVSSLKTETELHHRKVELARATLANDKKAAVEGKCLVLTFDMQKAFQLPKVPTSVVYYKRQLSCYNLGIYNCATSKGTMHLWHEGLAGRGPDEIGSCLLKFMRDFPAVEKLILWSDSCGGQNGNIKLVALLMRLVSDPTCSLNEVIHKFAIPGHSYLPNDTDFGHIEKKMMKQQHVFTLDEIGNLIKTCRSKKKAFDVIMMTRSDFINSERITRAITNRKKHDDHTVSWMNIRVLRVSKERPFIMEYKYSHNEDIQFHEVSFAKRMKGTATPLHEIVLQPSQPKPIKDSKKKDIINLMQFVPPVHQAFYHEIIQATQRTMETPAQIPGEIRTSQGSTADTDPHGTQIENIATDMEQSELSWDSEVYEEEEDNKDDESM